MKRGMSRFVSVVIVVALLGLVAQPAVAAMPVAEGGGDTASGLWAAIARVISPLWATVLGEPEPGAVTAADGGGSTDGRGHTDPDG